MATARGNRFGQDRVIGGEYVPVAPIIMNKRDEDGFHVRFIASRKNRLCIWDPRPGSGGQGETREQYLSDSYCSLPPRGCCQRVDVCCNRHNLTFTFPGSGLGLLKTSANNGFCMERYNEGFLLAAQVGEFEDMPSSHLHNLGSGPGPGNDISYGRRT